MSVCVHTFHFDTHYKQYDTRSILKLIGIQFSYSWIGCLTTAKEFCLPNYLPNIDLYW